MTALRQLTKGSPEAIAVQAGEIDAVIDYSKSNVFLLPAARRALRAAVAGDNAAERVGNHLLAALPPVDYATLSAALDRVTLQSDEVLHERNVRFQYVYFPIDCVLSLFAAVEGGGAIEVGLVGYEGMIGVSWALGAEHSSMRCVVQAGGTALRMKAARFSALLEQSAPLRREVNRYANSELIRARRGVACNCFHTVEGRLARWLLMMGDRVRAEAFYATQFLVAQILGVRRSTANIAAGALQQARLIDYCRGNVRILNRPGLTATACSCYRPIAR
jgi:CRP-like cAMP-binding protein